MVENNSSRSSSLTNNVFQQSEGQDQGINISSCVFWSNTEADCYPWGKCKASSSEEWFFNGEHSNQEVYLKNVTGGAFEGEFCLKLRGTKWPSNRRSSMEKCYLSLTKLILGGTHCWTTKFVKLVWTWAWDQENLALIRSTVPLGCEISPSLSATEVAH